MREAVELGMVECSRSRAQRCGSGGAGHGGVQ